MRKHRIVSLTARRAEKAGGPIDWERAVSHLPRSSRDAELYDGPERLYPNGTSVEIKGHRGVFTAIYQGPSAYYDPAAKSGFDFHFVRTTFPRMNRSMIRSLD